MLLVIGHPHAGVRSDAQHLIAGHELSVGSVKAKIELVMTGSGNVSPQIHQTLANFVQIWTRNLASISSRDFIFSFQYEQDLVLVDVVAFGNAHA